MLHLVLISLWNVAAGTKRAGETETEWGAAAHRRPSGLHFELQSLSLSPGSFSPKPSVALLADKPTDKMNRTSIPVQL